MPSIALTNNVSVIHRPVRVSLSADDLYTAFLDAAAEHATIMTKPNSAFITFI